MVESGDKIIVMFSGAGGLNIVNHIVGQTAGTIFLIAPEMAITNGS